MHGSAHKPRTLCNLSHLSLIPCKCSGGGSVPGACRAIACPDLCRASHTRSWLCIINFLGSCLLNGCPTHSKCWIGFLHCHSCDSSRCASPLFRSWLPWVDASLFLASWNNCKLHLKNALKYVEASKSILPFPSTHFDVFFFFYET